MHNRSGRERLLHLLPTLWFRNTWIWGCKHEDCTTKPNIEPVDASTLRTEHETLGRFFFAIGPDPAGQPAASAVHRE